MPVTVKMNFKLRVQVFLVLLVLTASGGLRTEKVALHCFQIQRWTCKNQFVSPLCNVLPLAERHPNLLLQLLRQLLDLLNCFSTPILGLDNPLLSVVAVVSGRHSSSSSCHS